MMSTLKHCSRPVFGALCLSLALAVGACNGRVADNLLTSPGASPENVTIEPAAAARGEYTMGTGDKIRLIVFGENAPDYLREMNWLATAGREDGESRTPALALRSSWHS